VEDVRQEVSVVSEFMKNDGGYVFCNVHNILAEIAPESDCHVPGGITLPLAETRSF